MGQEKEVCPDDTGEVSLRFMRKIFMDNSKRRHQGLRKEVRIML